MSASAGESLRPKPENFDGTERRQMDAVGVSGSQVILYADGPSGPSLHGIWTRTSARERHRLRSAFRLESLAHQPEVSVSEPRAIMQRVGR